MSMRIISTLLFGVVVGAAAGVAAEKHAADQRIAALTQKMQDWHHIIYACTKDMECHLAMDGTTAFTLPPGYPPPFTIGLWLSTKQIEGLAVWPRKLDPTQEDDKREIETVGPRSFPQ